MVLSDQPLCVMCLKLSMTTPADTVDHIEPHQGNAHLFWSMDNLQSLCASHHSGLKQTMERGGVGHDTACGVDGIPIDEKHPWNKGGGEKRMCWPEGYDGYNGTCLETCPSTCKGECGCEACSVAYSDALSGIDVG